MTTTAQSPVPTTFRARNLAVLCYAMRYTLWGYHANQPTLAAELILPVTMHEVSQSAFWQGAQDVHLAAGDMILATCADGGMLLWVESTSPMSIKVMSQS